MRKEEIVNEIKKKCGKVEMLPAIGWHFIYNTRHFFYINSNDDGIVRFCIPHLVKTDEYDMEQLLDAINDTNRSVKFIKVVKLDCGSVSLEYDHKMISDEKVEFIVPHIIDVLDFASIYLLDRLNNNSNNNNRN